MTAWYWTQVSTFPSSSHVREVASPPQTATARHPGLPRPHCQWAGFLPGKGRTSPFLILPVCLSRRLSPRWAWLRRGGTYLPPSPHSWALCAHSPPEILGPSPPVSPFTKQSFPRETSPVCPSTEHPAPRAGVSRTEKHTPAPEQVMEQSSKSLPNTLSSLPQSKEKFKPQDALKSC